MGRLRVVGGPGRSLEMAFGAWGLLGAPSEGLVGLGRRWKGGNRGGEQGEGLEMRVKGRNGGEGWKWGGRGGGG